MLNSNSVDELISLDEFAVLMEESKESSVFDKGGIVSRRLIHPKYGSLIAVQTAISSEVLVLKN